MQRLIATRIVATLFAGWAIVAAPPPVRAVTADDVNCDKCVGAKDVGKNAVTRKAFKKSAVTSKAIKNRSVKKADLHPSVIAGAANVVRVAGSGGDFNSPRAAVASITDASASNRYLVHVGPGVYELGGQSLQMKPFVDIRGAGVNATVLRGNVPSDTAGGVLDLGPGVVTGAANSVLSHLRVEHTGAGLGAGAVAISAGDSVTLENLVAQATGGGITAAILLTGGAPVIGDVHAIASEGAQTVAILMLGGRGSNITAEATGLSGLGSCGGALFDSARIENIVVTVEKCASSVAIRAIGDTHLRNVVAEATGSTDTVGLGVDDNSAVYGAVVEALGGSSDNVGAELADTSSLTSARLTAGGTGTAVGLDINGTDVRVTSVLATSLGNNPAGTQCRDAYELGDLTAPLGC